MNFMFSWQEQYLTRSLRSLVRYCSCPSNIKFISSRHCVIFSIYWPGVEVNNSGGSRGGPPLIFGPNWGPRGQENFFPDRPPYLRAWITASPPYLRVWTRQWINSLLRDNCSKLPTGEIGSQSENSIYFSFPTCESRHIIMFLFLYRFLQFFILLSFFHIPRLSLYALLKFTLGTYRKIVSVLSPFSLMPDYLTKLNQKWSRRFPSLIHLLQSFPSKSYLRLKRILDVIVFSLISWLLLKIV